jgi:MFS family permease
MFWYWFLLALSVTVESVVTNWKSWLVAKLLGGIGVGCLQSTIPTYVSEVAPVRIRGAFLMCYSLWWLIGQFFAPVALQVMSTYDPDNYLTPVYTQWSQIGLMLIIYLVIPESPAWFASKGRAKEAQAKKVLRLLYKGVPDFNIDHHYQLLVLNIEHERAIAAEQRNEKWYAIFKDTDGLRTLVSLLTLIAQQFLGLGVFLTFGSYFFQQAGIEDPFKVTCITSGINIFFSFVVIYLAETIGRRWLACSGTTLCWVCNVAVGILGVVPSGKVTNNLLIFFACLWSKPPPPPTPELNLLSTRRARN